jgi:hypothetical protein
MATGDSTDAGLNRRLTGWAARARERARSSGAGSPGPSDPRRPPSPRDVLRALGRLVALLVGAGRAVAGAVRPVLVAGARFARAELARAGAAGAVRLRAALAVAAREARSEPFHRRLAVVGAVAGALLLAIADFSRLRDVTVVTVVAKKVEGGEAHLYGLAVLGALGLVLTWGAALGHSRAAMRGLVALGALSLAIALALDLPRLDNTDGIEERYDEAVGSASVGFARELGGSLLLLASGAALLRTTPVPRRRRAPAPAGAAQAPTAG